jgi:cardiolipin hydrolase
MHHKFCLIDTQWLYTCESENEKPENNNGGIDKEENEKSAVKYIPENGILISGSVNWTMQGFTANWENIIITSNKSLVTDFQIAFEKIYHAFAPKLSF